MYVFSTVSPILVTRTCSLCVLPISAALGHEYSDPCYRKYNFRVLSLAYPMVKVMPCCATVTFIRCTPWRCTDGVLL